MAHPPLSVSFSFWTLLYPFVSFSSLTLSFSFNPHQNSPYTQLRRIAIMSDGPVAPPKPAVVSVIDLNLGFARRIG